jgi:hypothetical protein
MKMKNLFKSNFMKEVVADTAILSLLIILPMAFLGPGWRKPYHRPFAEVHRPQSGSSEEANDDGSFTHEEPPSRFKDR